MYKMRCNCYWRKKPHSFKDVVLYLQTHNLIVIITIPRVLFWWCHKHSQLMNKFLAYYWHCHLTGHWQRTELLILYCVIIGHQGSALSVIIGHCVVIDICENNCKDCCLLFTLWACLLNYQKQIANAYPYGSASAVYSTLWDHHDTHIIHIFL